MSDFTANNIELKGKIRKIYAYYFCIVSKMPVAADITTSAIAIATALRLSLKALRLRGSIKACGVLRTDTVIMSI